MATMGTPPATMAPLAGRPVPGRVSIVVPAYNCEATIAGAIESCLAQAYEDVEIIVVNDGSTDGTARVLERFADRIQVLHRSNGGVGAARNTGTRAATGEYVAWMDSDDLALPERLRIEVAVLASQPELVLVSSDFAAFVIDAADFDPSYIDTYYNSVRRLGGIASIYSRSTALDVPIASGPARFTVRSGRIGEQLLWGNFVHPPTVMVRRSAFDVAGLFDEELRYSAEYDLITRIARTGPFAYIDAPLLRYRIAETQLSHAAAGGRMPLETVRILDKIRREDPEMHARQRAVFRRRIAESLIGAAELIGAADRRQALRLLAQGVRSRLVFARAVRALAKILLPGSAITAVRRIKRVALPLAR